MAAPVVPAKQPTPAEILTNEVVPETPLNVVPVEVVSENAEKLVEPVADVVEALPEKVEVMTTLNDPIPVVEGEVLETASSEVVAPVVAAVASPAPAPVKDASEEEGLIEGIVNTFIGDGKQPENNNLTMIFTTLINFKTTIPATSFCERKARRNRPTQTKMMMTVRSREYESPKKFKLRLDIEISKSAKFHLNISLNSR